MSQPVSGDNSPDKTTEIYYDGLMNFSKFSQQNPIKKWLREIFFISPVVRQFYGAVLDMGCGPGIYLEKYSGPCLGIDAHPDNVEICLRKGIRAEVGDVNTFVRENTFDTILLSHVLEHLDNPARAIENAYRSLKTGGRLIIIVPCYAGFVAGLREDVGHKHFVAEEDIRQFFKSLNCVVISSSKFPPVFGGKFQELRVVYKKNLMHPTCVE